MELTNASAGTHTPITKIGARLKRLAKGSKSAIILFNVYNNLRLKRQFARGEIETMHGSTHDGRALEYSLSYIAGVFDDYFQYSDMQLPSLQGRRILEVGPGDNLGVALKFLVAGAEQVTCLDKFYAKRNVEQQRRIYAAMRRELSGDARARFDAAVSLEKGIEFNRARLNYIYGTGIEAADGLFPPGFFDVIISRVALQEVYNIDAAFNAMDTLLAPGGLMAHKIDLTDQRIFSGQGMHPLTFLTIPEVIYKFMGRVSGKSNRKLAGYYRQKMCALGYDTKLFISHLLGGQAEVLPHREWDEFDWARDKVGCALLKEIRPKLSRQFRHLSNKELVVDGIYLAARKPGKRDAWAAL